MLRAALGGDGRAEENIVIIYDRANNEVMEHPESRDLFPTGIHIRATGHGFDIDQTIINP